MNTNDGHQIDVEIFYEDTDAGGVVYYANYLKYFERARMKFMEQEGISVTGWARNNRLFVVTHAEVSYKSPARLGDLLNVHTRIKHLTKVRLEFEHTVTLKERLIVTATTCLACINSSGKVLRIDLGKLRNIPHGS